MPTTRRATRPATLVVFTCNHCPYALAWHDRIAAVAARLPERQGLAVNSNDAERYPRDSFEAMRERVAGRLRLAVPYLYDETQDVARAYGAKTTPDCFLLDAEAASRTAARPTPTTRTRRRTRRGCATRSTRCWPARRPPRRETKPVGCSIKWKQGYDAGDDARRPRHDDHRQ